MEQPSIDLDQWIKSIEEYTPVPWDRLPELELYMDQIVTFLNRQLEPFATGDEHTLTPSMVNNYVKDGVLPRPEKKKYSRNHIAMLMMICSLKSVLSLPEIKEMLQGLTDNQEIDVQYPLFAGAYGQATKEITSRMKHAPDKDREDLYKLALQLALEANARQIASAHILSCLTVPKKPEKEKDKAKEKE